MGTQTAFAYDALNRLEKVATWKRAGYTYMKTGYEYVKSGKDLNMTGINIRLGIDF